MSNNACTRDALLSTVRYGTPNKLGTLLRAHELPYLPTSQEGYQLLCEAVQLKRATIVRMLLSRGFRMYPAEGCRASVTPLLHCTVANADLDSASAILEYCGTAVTWIQVVNARNEMGDTALHEAAKRGSGHSDMIELLLSHKVCQINAKNNGGETPLLLAARKRRAWPIVSCLLSNGAHVDCAYETGPRQGYTPLHLAAEAGHEKIVKLLLEGGASVDAKAKKGEITALQLVLARRRSTQSIELLLRFGASVNLRGMDLNGRPVQAHGTGNGVSPRGYSSPLLIAIEADNPVKTIKLLLDRGAEVNEDEDGSASTPLCIATRLGNFNVVKLLLDHGANVNVRDTEDGRKTVLHLAVEMGHERIVELLLARGANIETRNEEKKTILQLAVEAGQTRIVEYILRWSPRPNPEDEPSTYGRSLIRAAVYSDSENNSASGEIFESLLRHGFLLDHEDVELVHTAVAVGDTGLIEHLLELGANVNSPLLLPPQPSPIRVRRGYTTLYTAAAYSQVAVARLLISHGANVDVWDQEAGGSPLSLAIARNDEQMFHLLLENGADATRAHPQLLYAVIKNNCRPSIVEALLLQCDKAGFVVDDIADDEMHGRTALLLLVFYRDKSSSSSIDAHKSKIARLLLTRGARVDACSKDGVTVLQAAAQHGYARVVETLLDYSAKVDYARIDRATPLCLAVQFGHTEIVVILLRAGAVIDRLGSGSERAQTALHIAVIEGNVDIATLLLAFDANVDVVNGYNCTSLEYAKADVGLLFGIVDFHNNHDLDEEDNCRGCDICSNREVIAEMLTFQVIKLSRAGLPVSEKNLALLDESEVADFMQRCDKELERMRTDKIVSCGSFNVTFYGVLTCNASRLARYTRNQDVVKVLCADNYRARYPIYAELVASRLKASLERSNLMEKCKRVFLFSESLAQLPDVCIEKVLDFLGNENFKTIEAICEKKV